MTEPDPWHSYCTHITRTLHRAFRTYPPSPTRFDKRTGDTVPRSNTPTYQPGDGPTQLEWFRQVARRYASAAHDRSDDHDFQGEILDDLHGVECALLDAAVDLYLNWLKLQHTRTKTRSLIQKTNVLNSNFQGAIDRLVAAEKEKTK